MSRAILFACCALAVLLLFTSPALAHERRTLGKYELVVGWRVEPAFVDQPNGLDFRVAIKETNQPMAGLENTLKAQVLYGGKVRDLELRPQFGRPGAYTDDIVPTRAGAFAFRIFGNIEGLAIDERFEPREGGFHDVDRPSEDQFPEEAPSSSELAPLVATANEAARQAQQAVGSARTLGLVGIVIGALGVVAGGVALTLARRRR